MPCFLYYCIIEPMRSQAENCAIERFTCPLLKNLFYYREKERVLMWVDGWERKKKKKNNVSRKTTLYKTDLVKVEGKKKKKHTAEPGVHPGNNNSLNNNDYKLLSGAER